ncbi:MAG: hypothetical protein ACJATA_000890 [Sphingobacteriales bacterium]
MNFEKIKGMNKLFSVVIVLLFSASAEAQQTYWQQKMNCQIEVEMEVETNKFKGNETLTYYNQSPDTLKKAFFHLYFNAFQPGSMMDVRSRTISDPDRRVGSRISKLKADEIGYQNITKFEQNGKPAKFEIVGTVLEVTLNEPILPGKKATFKLDFNGQVPLQVRRSGRDNAEGIRLSMAQWYPKIAEYDFEGWHADPYVAREFYGVWGDFDVKITLDSSYVVGGTGYLQNAQEIGHGYEKLGKEVKRPNTKMLTWHFKAPKVHDFMWAADPDYTHVKTKVPNGPELHFLYQKDSTTTNWDSLPKYASQAISMFSKQFGEYPYKQYSVIQGGDGGMEYPMATLITGKRGLKSLVGVTIHEMGHSWYQMILATNEAKYPWMDEGFCTYASDIVRDSIFGGKGPHPHTGSYFGYAALVKSGQQEPLATKSDFYHTNRAYGISAYSMGAVFASQMRYIIGDEAFDRGMLRYFNTWKFKHPHPNDFVRIMEKESGLELGWYLNQWVYTMNTIDYGVKNIESDGTKTEVTLEKKGRMPMPLEVMVKLKSGETFGYNIPLEIMRGEKKNPETYSQWITLKDWPWPYPEYKFTIGHKILDIESIDVNPTKRMADIEDNNDVYPFKKDVTFKGDK